MPTTTDLYVSTPVLRIGGATATGPMSHLRSLIVEEDIHGMSWMQARFVNWGNTGSAPGYLYFGRTELDFGTQIEVAFGPQTTTLFRGRISALGGEFPPDDVATLVVSAEDRLQDLRMTRRTRTFEKVSTEDVARSLAADHGLRADVTLPGPTRTVVNQLNLSDLALLRQLACADGGEVWLDDTTLYVRSRRDRDVDEITLSYGGDLLSFEALADLAHQVTDVVVTGWSVADKDDIAETADASVLGAESSGGSTGSDVLASAFNARHEHIVVSVPLASDDARSRAAAAYLSRARRFVCGSGTTGGTPELRVGCRTVLTGLGAMFNGEYRVVRTRHRYHQIDGYTTEFEVERPTIGGAK